MNKQVSTHPADQPWTPINGNLNHEKDLVALLSALIMRASYRAVPHPDKLVHIGDWFERIRAFFVGSMTVRTGSTIKLKKVYADALKAAGFTIEVHHVGSTFIDIQKKGWLIRFFYDGGIVNLSL